MKKTCLIKQNAGLGDIFYCQKIAKEFIKNGYEVYWPVIPQFSYIPDYIKYPGIHFESFSTPDISLNLQHATDDVWKTRSCSIMDAKYILADIDNSDWIDYFTFDRDINKETELYNMLVNTEKYCLICNTYASPPDEVYLKIEPDTNLPKIYIQNILNFTPFDWCKLIENATELYFVDTCFTYFVEKLKIKAEKMVLYPREPHHRKIITKSNWRKDWEYVDKSI